MQEFLGTFWFLFFYARLTLRKIMYIPLAAANRTALPKIVIGNMICEVGDTASASRGVNNAKGAKGKARAMHMKALESAPPKPPA